MLVVVILVNYMKDRRYVFVFLVLGMSLLTSCQKNKDSVESLDPIRLFFASYYDLGENRERPYLTRTKQEVLDHMKGAEEDVKWVKTNIIAYYEAVDDLRLARFQLQDGIEIELGKDGAVSVAPP